MKSARDQQVSQEILFFSKPHLPNGAFICFWQVGLRFCCCDYCLLLSYSSWEKRDLVGQANSQDSTSFLLPCAWVLYFVLKMFLLCIFLKSVNASFIKSNSISWWVTLIQENIRSI